MVWLLLYPYALSRWGTTPGRALLDLEVISERSNGRRDGRVGFLQAVQRFLAEYGVFVAGAGITDLGRVVGNEWIKDGAAVPAILGAIYMGTTVLVTATRSIDKRTLWDQASDTRTCYRRPADARPA
jgi:hypothetical protein